MVRAGNQEPAGEIPRFDKLTLEMGNYVAVAPFREFVLFPGPYSRDLELELEKQTNVNVQSSFHVRSKGFLNKSKLKAQTQSFNRTFSCRDGQQQPTQCGRLLQPFSSCCRQKSFKKVNRQNVYSPNLRHQRTASMTPENWWWASVLLLVFLFSLPCSLMCRLWLVLL